MNRREQIIFGTLGLLIAACACIAAWLVVPQPEQIPEPQPVTVTLIPTIPTAESQLVTFDITLFTGCVDSGGTDAHVYITLIGSKGSGDEVELFTANYDQRQRCAKDNYAVKSDDLGDLVQLEIRHDNCCNGPGWFLEKVVVSNRATNQSWEFLCHRWLAVNMEDHRIHRTIYPAGPCK
jgi:hypothetical protein